MKLRIVAMLCLVYALFGLATAHAAVILWHPIAMAMWTARLNER
jgi:hypothetical protein